MRPLSVLPLAALGALAAAALWPLVRGEPPAPVATADPPGAGSAEPRRAALAAAPTTAPARGVAVATDPATGALIRADNRHAAGRRTPCEVAPVSQGIRCPDGSHLPLLNGVDSAPPLLRAGERGPLPPVVAVVVDRDGWDWYEHADGSTTTCRPHTLIGPDGRPAVRVVTLHNAPDPDMRELPLDPDPTAPDRSR